MKSGMKRQARRGGFTLLEVLLVLAILGVIAAIVVPSLLGRQQEAMVRTTKSSIAGLETALQAYAIDHNGRPPQGSAQEVNQMLMAPEPIDGRQVDPLKEELPKAEPLDVTLQPEYFKYITPIKDQLDCREYPQMPTKKEAETEDLASLGR